MQAGGTVTLENFSGRVEITGEPRSDVAIVAIRKATRERLDRIKLDIRSDGRSVTIEANKRDTDWGEKTTTSSRPTSRSRCPRAPIST